MKEQKNNPMTYQERSEEHTSELQSMCMAVY